MMRNALAVAGLAAASVVLFTGTASAATPAAATPAVAQPRIVGDVLGAAGNAIGSAFGALVPKDTDAAFIAAAQGNFKPTDSLTGLAGQLIGGAWGALMPDVINTASQQGAAAVGGW